jgi:AcrR family transcriptional regulator
MPRPRSIEEDDLIGRLARVFREVGFEGASLSILAQATGLQRASLYHRFPGGKQQMAEEVLTTTGAWLEAKVLQVLSGPWARPGTGWPRWWRTSMGSTKGGRGPAF